MSGFPRPDWQSGSGRVSPSTGVAVPPTRPAAFRGSVIAGTWLSLAGLTSMRFAYEAALVPQRWRSWSPARSTGWTAGWRGC
jgi:hypothetical protein